MLESVLEKAEYIGHLLAGEDKKGKKSNQEAKSLTHHSSGEDVYFLIKPFKENEM